MSKFQSFNFQDKKVLLRVDLNVPIDKQTKQISDLTRIDGAVPTIKHILEKGGSVILMSHMGRPKEGPEEKSSLRQLIPALEEKLGTSVAFANDCVGTEATEKAAALAPGQVLLLENLRFYKEEEKGDEGFAKKLAALGNVYVNDAFGTAHRAHASTAVMAASFAPENRMSGLLMEAEVNAAQKVLKQHEKPFVAIIGGAKVSDKILIIENLLQSATDIIIGGGMAYTFMKASGGSIGNSLCEDDRLDTARELLKKAEEMGVNIHLPGDSIVADKFDEHAQTSTTPSNKIPDGWMGLDIGPNATEQFCHVIMRSKTILWNGPMGVFEMQPFSHGTKAIAHAVADATSKQGAYSLIGGGDSVAAINKFGLAGQVSHVSTGGGAMLEFFEGKELPGISAVEA